MTNDSKEIIALPETISLRSLAGLIKRQPTELIAKLMAGGVLTHINQNLDFDTAALLVGEFGFTAEEQTNESPLKKASNSSSALARAPIITIMGHVDHGKTSLLDYIRQSNVAESESGGITQHISAYQIDFPMPDKTKRKITFIDTPGHEAFGALRAHGASLTDLVILVVAADDGVKPQTTEALEYARKANVPIIVAINKIDLPGSNQERVKQQLVELKLTPEDWGGKTTVVPVSAKTGEGVSHLLELVILTTDLLELKADPQAPPEGIVIEARQDKNSGPLATALVYNGTLRPGQVVVAGKTYGRIRAIENDRGERVVAAPPAMPVRILGLKDVAKFGDRVETVPNEKLARIMVQAQTGRPSAVKVKPENCFPIILQADVGGSLAALLESIRKLKVKDAVVEVLKSGIGEVNESEIHLGKTAKALIVTFRVTASKRIKELAVKEKVEIREYWVIYELLEMLAVELKKIATPTFEIIERGRFKVLAVFSRQGEEAIIGGELLEGELAVGKEAIVQRQKEEIGQGEVKSARIGKVEVSSVEVGQQCGLQLTKVASVEKGDILTFIERRQV